MRWPGSCLRKPFSPRGDDDDPGKPFLLRPVQRDGAGAAAVQVGFAVQPHRHRDQRQAGRRPAGFQKIETGAAFLKIGGLAGAHAGGDGDHPLAAVVEGPGVEGDLFGQVVEHEAQPEQAAAVEGRLGAEVARVVAVAQVDAGRPPRLVRHVVHAVEGPRADPRPPPGNTGPLPSGRPAPPPYTARAGSRPPAEGPRRRAW